MSIKKTVFGRLKDGREAYRFTIQNTRGMTADVTNYGAVLISLMAENKDGVFRDVVLGYDDLKGYLDNHPMFGATVGRNANRISNAEFTLEGKVWRLCRNRGPHNIHSDKEKGFHKVLWDYEITGSQAVKFYYISPDGDLGFPGEWKVSVTYTLTEGNGLIISYYGTCDRKSLINMTNHSYFNLAGHDKGEIYNTEITIFGDSYTPVNEDIIPTGEILPVNGTPMDFTVPRRICQAMAEEHPQLRLAGGYDHNYVIRNPHKGVRKIAEAADIKEQIRMEVYSDLPGMQFYTGNSLNGDFGKALAVYQKGWGFCMEPQYFPNSINTRGFEAPVFNKDEEYKTTTIYQFC